MSNSLSEDKNGVVEFFCPFFGGGGVFWVMVRFESEKCLAEFVKLRSEEAFRKVVAEQSGLVLGTAARRLGGDRSGAEDVMQEVFVLLARKARVLVRGEISVSGWLYRQTCRLAANRVRGEVRRRKREEKFGSGEDEGIETKNEMTGEIDEALLRLDDEERELVLARYVEERDYAEIGKKVGISGEAARKRVARAMEKLRVILEKSGVRVSASALAVTLVGVSGPRASAELVASVSRVAMKSGVVVGGGTFSIVGILAGAAGVSVVMGGVRMMDAEKAQKVEVAKSGRAMGSRGSVLERLQMAELDKRPMSDEKIYEHLIALDGEPVTLVSDLMLEQVLESVGGERFFEFVDWAGLHVSMGMRERICFALVGRSMEYDPAGTLERMLEKGIFKVGQFGDRYSGTLGVRAFSSWSGKSLEESLNWLMDHWGDLDALGRKGGLMAMETARRRQGPFQPLNNDTVADELGQSLGLRVFASGGLEAVERFVTDLDDQSKVAVWKYVFLLTPKPGELYPRELAECLGKFPDKEPFGELKEVSWLRWYQLWGTQGRDGRRMTKEEYMEFLPQEFAAEFKKACLDEIIRDGEGVGE